MTIQWFPGHMTAARKKAAETMADVDVVLEVLDARLPQASSNPMIETLRLARQRPCLKVLNKADLADPGATSAWIDFYQRQKDVKAVAISAKKAADVARLPALCQSLAPHRNDNFKPLRIMIMGIPNVGKSTLLNALVKKRVAKVGDEPAVTKSQQRIILSPRLILIDTPGLMWPKIEHDADGYMLAASHAIGVNAVPEEEVATFLAGILIDRYPALHTARYGFETRGARRHRAPARCAAPRRRDRPRKGGAHSPHRLPQRCPRPHQPGNAGEPRGDARLRKRPRRRARAGSRTVRARQRRVAARPHASGPALRASPRRSRETTPAGSAPAAARTNSRGPAAAWGRRARRALRARHPPRPSRVPETGWRYVHPHPSPAERGRTR
jgi:ribosome biogenesis GTPase A